MHSQRRATLKALSAVGAIGLSGACASLQAGFMDDTISVTVKVQDEAGKPIPFVTVWSAIEYEKQHVKDNGYYQYLKLTDLWRITQRYNVLHDIISLSGDRPVAALWIPVMGNVEGIFHSILDYKHETGKGNNYPRPDPLTFGYTFMKHGFLPGKVSFTVSKNQNRVEAVVTLLRNLSQALETQPYLQTFARVRYELSDYQKNTVQTLENQQRMAGLQAQLEQAAQQAIAAGDKPAAARIYARMRYLPSLHIIDGRIAGWSQGDANSEQAKRALDMAYQLDPDNLYVWMETYLRRMQLPSNATREQRAAAALREVEKLISAKGEAVWPMCFVSRAGGYAVLGDYVKAYRLFLEAAQLEPKYMDWNERIEKLKIEMKRKGVAIPADVR